MDVLEQGFPFAEMIVERLIAGILAGHIFANNAARSMRHCH